MKLFFTKTATVYRLADDAGTTKKETYSSTANGTILGALMNAKPEDTMLGEGNPSKSMTFFCDIYSDLKESDKIVIDGENYIVRGVSKTVGIGMNLAYMKALIEKMLS